MTSRTIWAKLAKYLILDYDMYIGQGVHSIWRGSMILQRWTCRPQFACGPGCHVLRDSCRVLYRLAQSMLITINAYVLFSCVQVSYMELKDATEARYYHYRESQLLDLDDSTR